MDTRFLNRIFAGCAYGLTVGVLLLCAWSMAWAAESSFERARELAENTGDANAKFMLGNFYARGDGVKQDHTEAARWYLSAAQQGHVKAKIKLGLAYMQGLGVKKSQWDARLWLQSAADQGDTDAQYHLATMLRRGQVGKVEADEALRWYSRAADQNHPAAQYELGLMYQEGVGVTADEALAQEWFHRAAANGHRIAQQRLYGKAPRSAPAPAPAPVKTHTEHKHAANNESSLPETIQQEMQWASEGDSKAQYRLAMAYKLGSVIPHNHTEALRWFNMAANKGHADAQYELGNMYYQGDAARKDTTAALKWLKKAAQQNHAGAKDMLAKLQPPVAAVKTTPPPKPRPSYVVIEPADNDANGQYNYAMGLLRGENGRVDAVGAAQWLRKAATNDHALALYELANLHLKGDGVQKDVGLAIKLYRKAADRGVSNADKALKEMSASGFSDLVAAESGDADAQLKLGLRAIKSNDRAEIKQGIAWLELAAAQGNIDAQLRLAEVYSTGTLVRRELETAFLWFKAAAEAGNSDAQYQLAEMYAQGQGTKPDNARATHWFREAARSGHPKARLRLGGCLLCD